MFQLEIGAARRRIDRGGTAKAQLGLRIGSPPVVPYPPLSVRLSGPFFFGTFSAPPHPFAGSAPRPSPPPACSGGFLPVVPVLPSRFSSASLSSSGPFLRHRHPLCSCRNLLVRSVFCSSSTGCKMLNKLGEPDTIHKYQLQSCTTDKENWQRNRGIRGFRVEEEQPKVEQ